MNDTKALLEAVKDGLVSVDEALLELKKAPFEDLGYAKIAFTANSARAFRKSFLVRIKPQNRSAAFLKQ